MTPLRLIRGLCIATFIAGIPSIIVSSILGNNEGYVVSFGSVTAIAAIVMLATSAVTNSKRLDAFDEVLAEKLEQRVTQLVAAGADENELRQVVREAMNLARGQQ
jgi:hypothetical protein